MVYSEETFKSFSFKTLTNVWKPFMDIYNKNPLAKNVFTITSKAQVAIKLRDTYMLDHFLLHNFLLIICPWDKARKIQYYTLVPYLYIRNKNRYFVISVWSITNNKLIFVILFCLCLGVYGKHYYLWVLSWVKWV